MSKLPLMLSPHRTTPFVSSPSDGTPSPLTVRNPSFLSCVQWTKRSFHSVQLLTSLLLNLLGHDFGAIDSAIAKAKSLDNGKPTIIIAKTIIGKGIPEVEGTNAAHGEAGVPFQKTARAHLGLPADELWHVAPEVSWR